MKKLVIKNTTPIQEDFWGNGAVYHGFAGMPDDAGRVYTKEQCDLEAKRAGDMRLKFVRTKYYWWAWDKETNSWDWDNEVMTAFYAWLERMKKHNITVSLNTGWCSPGDILSNSWNGVSPFTVPGDWEASNKKFGDWVSETVHQIIEVRGFTNVKCLTMFTEPQHFSSNGEPIDPTHTPYTCWFDSTKAAHDALVRDGRRHLVKFMGPNEGHTLTSDMLHWVADRNPDFVDIYSSHAYQFDRDMPYDIVRNGAGGVASTTCGGRVMQPVTLMPNAEYTAKVRFIFNKNADEDIKGRFLFGVFQYDDSKDLYNNATDLPFDGLTDNSLFNITSDMIKEGEQTLSFNFKIDDEVKGQIGFFFDVATKSATYVTYLDLIDSNGNSVVNNPNLFNAYDGWEVAYAGGGDQSYYEWYKWCKTGMQYVPEGKTFCYDEYNSIYDRDNSRYTHGTDIVTAALAMMNAGAQSSFIWTVFDQLWPNNHCSNNDSFVLGEHRCGVMPTFFQSLVPHKSYYAFALLSKYVSGEGTKVFEGMSSHRVATTMSVSPEGEITVVVVNAKDEADDFEITFGKALDSVKFNRHTFDPATCVPDEKAEIVGIDKITEPITDKLCDKIAAYGVTVYTTIKD